MNTSEICKQITEKIIANLATAGSWQKLWSMPAGISMKGHIYTGINRLIMSANQYDVPVYGTFDQIRSNGGVVRKGEKATVVVFWKRLNKIDEETKKEKTFFVLRYYWVFNVAQADFDDKGKQLIVELSAKVSHTRDNARVDSAEDVIASMQHKPHIVYSNSDERAYYSPMSDKVSVPEIKYFQNTEAFYATLFHELTHSTGHPSRLDRFDIGSSAFGSESYSKEELVAELGASFLCAICNINNDIQNSAAYISGWSKALRDNTSWIISAASKAEAASNFILYSKADEAAA